MKKVSFDFDGTLSRLDVQKYAKSLIEQGFEVWIVTSRLHEKNADTKRVGSKVGTKVDRRASGGTARIVPSGDNFFRN